MRAISESERGGLLRVSASLCAFAMLLLPMAAQSSAPSVSVDLDPLAAIAVPTVAPRSPRASRSERVRDPFVPIVDDEGAAKALAPIILAFASGARPVALVEVDGQTIALAVGAPAFGARVTHLDAHAVRLSDGRTLFLRSPS
jgi:hypothetical protein